MSAIARALLDELEPDDLEWLAQRLAPFLPTPTADGWLDTKATAEHLGISVHALHRLVADRRIPFTQERPGAKCYFRRSDLDAWRSVRP
jgi:excisionase family DNA binding protein